MEGLASFTVRLKETDLHIQADGDFAEAAEASVVESRLQIENYIAGKPLFASSLHPLEPDTTAPPLIQEMLKAGSCAGVGPMAAVAGAVAEFVGRRLLHEGAKEVIVENGGDVFLLRSSPSTIAIFAGTSPLSYRVGIELPGERPMGVCTSSGTVGHSLSFGTADSVTVIASSTSLADAVATRLGNEVGKGRASEGNINNVLVKGRTFEGVEGIVIICDTLMGAVGNVKLVQLG